MPPSSEHPLAGRLRALANAFRRTRPPTAPPLPEDEVRDRDAGAAADGNEPPAPPAAPLPDLLAAERPADPPVAPGPTVLAMPNAPLSWYVAGLNEAEALALAEALTQLGLEGQRFLRCPHDRTRIYYLRPEDVRGVVCPLCGADDFLVFEMES